MEQPTRAVGLEARQASRGRGVGALHHHPALQGDQSFTLTAYTPGGGGSATVSSSVQGRQRMP